jgi:pimeloyl-ACP methyl ester carboxylesterase
VHREFSALSRLFSYIPIVIFFVALGISYGQDSPYRAPTDIDVRPGYTLAKETLTEREIPVLLLWKDSFASSRKPVVFLLHGGGMPDVVSESDAVAKDLWFLPEFYGVPYTLADGGLLVVIMDQWWAGERFKEAYRAEVRANYLEAVIRGYTETTNDITLMLDALASRSDADTGRAGVTGRSGGGIVSLMAAAHEPRVAAVTSWVGTGDMVMYAKTKLPERAVEHFMNRAPNLPALLDEYDPVNRLYDVPPTAVLMMNNRTDPLVSFDAAQSFYERLETAYADAPERVLLRVLDTPEPTHALTRKDYEEGCAWLVKHLTDNESR